MVSPTHPFYLHPLDNPSSRLVSPSFDGTGYIIWRKTMLTSLSAKNKLGLSLALSQFYFPILLISLITRDTII